MSEKKPAAVELAEELAALHEAVRIAKGERDAALKLQSDYAMFAERDRVTIRRLEGERDASRAAARDLRVEVSSGQSRIRELIRELDEAREAAYRAQTAARDDAGLRDFQDMLVRKSAEIMAGAAADRLRVLELERLIARIADAIAEGKRS